MKNQSTFLKCLQVVTVAFNANKLSNKWYEYLQRIG